MDDFDLEVQCEEVYFEEDIADIFEDEPVE